MIKKIFVLTLTLILACNNEEKSQILKLPPAHVLIVLPKKFITSCFDKNYKQIVRSIKEPVISKVLVKEQKHFFCENGDSIYFGIKLFAPVSLLGDSVIEVSDENRQMSFYFPSQNSNPVAIVCEAGNIFN